MEGRVNMNENVQNIYKYKTEFDDVYEKGIWNQLIWGNFSQKQNQKIKKNIKNQNSLTRWI